MIIDSYEKLEEFNNSLKRKGVNKVLNISKIDYTTSTIVVNSSESDIGKFLADFITKADSYIDFNLDYLKYYNFTELYYIMHPEEFKALLDPYIKNLNMLGQTTFSICDFELELTSPKDIRLINYTGSKSRKHITIPSVVTEIGEYAFTFCDGLKSVTFPPTIKSIHRGAFENSGLESIELPESLEVIGPSAFRNCYNLKKVGLPKKLKWIGAEAFKHIGIEEINIPEGIERIKGGAFHFCQNLKKVHLPDSLKVTEICAFSHTAIESISLPEGLEIVGPYSFAGCQNLKDVTLPNELKEIDDSAFSDTSVEEVNIPDSVEEIGLGVFRDCIKLTRVKMPEHLIKMGDEVFSGTPLESIVNEHLSKSAGGLTGCKPKKIYELRGKVLEAKC